MFFYILYDIAMLLGAMAFLAMVVAKRTKRWGHIIVSCVLSIATYLAFVSIALINPMAPDVINAGLWLLICTFNIRDVNKLRGHLQQN